MLWLRFDVNMIATKGLINCYYNVIPMWDCDSIVLGLYYDCEMNVLWFYYVLQLLY